MSAEDIIRTSGGALRSQTDGRGGAVLIPHPVVGIVKHNIDTERAGRIKVYLKKLIPLPILILKIPQ